MNKYMMVNITDNNDGELRVCTVVDEDMVQQTALTILNKVLLVTDAWGYCEYEEAYPGIVEQSKSRMIDHWNSVFGVVIGTYDKVADIVDKDFMTQIDEFLLAGFEEYDSATEPFDMKEVLPTLDHRMYEGA